MFTQFEKSDLPSAVAEAIRVKNQIMIAAQSGNESEAAKLFTQHVKNAHKHAKHVTNASGVQVFGNLQDFVYHYESLQPSTQYQGIYQEMRAANGGRVNISINDLIFAAKTRSGWGDPSYGIKVLDDNTNERLVGEDCALVPFTAKSYRQQWRQQISGGAESDRMEAEETVLLGQDWKFYNGATQGNSDDSPLLSYAGTKAYGLSNHPDTKVFTLSNWNTADDATILGDLGNLVLWAKRQAITTNSSDIKLHITDGFEGRLTRPSTTVAGAKTILALFGEQFAGVAIKFVPAELIGGQTVLCWNNNRSSILYPTAMDIEAMDWKMCSPVADEKVTVMSIDGILLRRSKWGTVAAAKGELPAESEFMANMLKSAKK